MGHEKQYVCDNDGGRDKLLTVNKLVIGKYYRGGCLPVHPCTLYQCWQCLSLAQLHTDARQEIPYMV